MNTIQWWSDFFKRHFGRVNQPQTGGGTPVVVAPPAMPVEPPKTSLYTAFDPELTLPDDIFGAFDENLDMQGFFEAKGSYLATYKVNGKSVAQIINDACRPYSVNQKYILVLLQKEQGAWSTPDISKVPPHSVFTRYRDANGKYVMNSDGTYSRKEYIIYPADWCLGFGVPDDDPPNVKYQGFENQIVSCAKRIRYLFDQGQSQIGKMFQTLGYTVLTDNLLAGKSDDDKAQMAINLQRHLGYVSKFGLKVSSDPEKYILVNIKNQWAWLLIMYTPWTTATELTWTIWNREWSEDLSVPRNS